LRTIAIIQARMDSSRLPGKILADIAGKSMIERVIERVAAAQSVDEVVVATTSAVNDDILIDHLRKTNACAVFRGSSDDVLRRFSECAKLHHADVVVRVTADDPLKDPQIIDKATSLLITDARLDYCSNTIEPSYPEGLDIEVMHFSALERADKEAQLASEREHVTPYIWKNPGLFQILNFRSDRDLNDWRWTVDRQEDLEFMRRVFGEFRDRPLVLYQDVIAWLDAHPDVRQINSGIHRNEGYLKSIKLEN
jgi:spore coat polysaccharide biosynthesis protein SpsF